MTVETLRVSEGGSRERADVLRRDPIEAGIRFNRSLELTALSKRREHKVRYRRQQVLHDHGRLQDHPVAEALRLDHLVHAALFPIQRLQAPHPNRRSLVIAARATEVWTITRTSAR